ncbi:MAG TPA: HAMP domain-containing sensor histidine kinase [Spirillospora sp.]|nr:HAMP domain-containing sensor histidine kinase [Spirillospora sp.]
MRLHTRLLLSYIVVIAVTLGVIVVALLLFLNTRPAPPQNTYRQLGASAQANLRAVLNVARPGVLGRTLATREFVEQLRIFSEDSGVRTLLISPNDPPAVIFDSSGTFAEGAPIRWQIDEAGIDAFRGMMVGGVMGMGPAGRLDTITGSFENPDNSTWLFFSLTVLRGGNQIALLYALPQPTQTLREALEEFSSALARPTLQAAFTGLVIAMFMAILISRAIVRPLLHITDAARAVAAGDYDQQVPVTGPPEVRTVAEAFNTMTHEVKAAQKAQHDFMVNISHDLKTPLTSIQGYSQAIMDGATSDPVQSASVIYEEAARLNRMVAEITDLARLQDGQLGMNKVDLDFSQIVSAIGQRLAIVAEKEGIDLQVEVDSLPHIAGDGDRLAQVITNLVSNAITYTPRGGRVHVRTQANNGGVELIVADTGVGIATEDLPRIFERFYQVDKARGPRRGTGLGLAITREIVQAHGGTIRVTSAGPDAGSVFTVWLPAANASVSGKRQH